MKSSTKGFVGQRMLLAMGLAVVSSAWAVDSNLKDEVRSSAVSSTGRALVSVEDLKVLLGSGERDPSSADVVVAHNSEELPLSLKIPAHKRESLVRRVKKLEDERLSLAEKLDHETAAKKAAVRMKRREIQMSRTTKDGSSLGSRLYESLLEESNYDAQKTQKLADFDRDHRIVVEFNEAQGQREIVAVKIGATPGPETQLAKR